MANAKETKRWLDPDTYRLEGQLWKITPGCKHLKVGVTSKTEGKTSQGEKCDRG